MAEGFSAGTFLVRTVQCHPVIATGTCRSITANLTTTGYIANGVDMKNTRRFFFTLQLSILLLIPGMVYSAEPARALRPMLINKVDELGLEIWTEADPEWLTDVVHQQGKPIFTAQTPMNTYPPAAMSVVSFPGMEVAESELLEVATSAIHTAARNYQVTEPDISGIQITPVRYSELHGFEGVFSGVAQGDPVDVKVFIGQREGKSPVCVQIYTLKGKLPHLSEQIRRSWQHLRYLEAGS